MAGLSQRSHFVVDRVYGKYSVPGTLMRISERKGWADALPWTAALKIPNPPRLAAPAVRTGKRPQTPPMATFLPLTAPRLSRISAHFDPSSVARLKTGRSKLREPRFEETQSEL